MTNHIGLDELAIQEGIRKPWETLLMMTKTPYGLYAFTHKDLEHFAALVAAHEREACAKVVEQIFDDLAKDNFVGTAVANLICNFGDFVGKPLIEAIRERGEQ